jgi:DNA polymerase III alpha subunit (gram-positive type)
MKRDCSEIEEKEEVTTVFNDCPTPNKKQKIEPYFMFFDIETNGIGSFRPFEQTVVQVSWTLTDRCNNTIDTYTSFVKGATALEYNPNQWSLEQINAGEEPALVASKFVEAAQHIVGNGGYLVAHNINFDLSGFESLGVDVKTLVPFNNRFCTMACTTFIVKLPNRKWPKQQQLKDFLFPTDSNLQTHDASDDVNVLRRNFFECVRRARGGNPLYKKFRF